MDPQPLRAAALRLKSQVRRRDFTPQSLRNGNRVLKVDSGRLPGVMACAVKEGTVIHFEAHSAMSYHLLPTSGLDPNAFSRRPTVLQTWPAKWP